MATTLTRVLVHITFSTKHRAPMIPESIEAEFGSYIGGICRRMECTLVAMGGTADHVHLLVDLSKKVALSDLLLDIKRDTSRWIKDRHPDLGAFAWQEGYFAFSIGESAVDALRAYFADQKRHHQRRGYQDEMRELFRKYGIECDEQYVWT